jgi:serine/threonine-protein kinase HipA
MPICRVCLKTTKGSDHYHQACLERLFGTESLPNLEEVELSNLYRIASEMAGKMSISGVQEKLSLALSPDKSELRLSPTGGRYILKPEPARYSTVPQNEHVTMLMASLVEIETPPFGLIWLKDGTPAYIIKRFDRTDDGRKLHVEDFCQLSEIPLKDKYHGSGEECVRILKKYASEPLVEIRKLLKVLLFSWWVANGDQHLKNLSLEITLDGIRRLAPAYDLLCTRLVIPKDRHLSLSIVGKKAKLTRTNWLEFATYCGITGKTAERVLAEQVNALGPSIELIRNSFLNDDLRAQYIEIINVNTSVLTS